MMDRLSTIKKHIADLSTVSFCLDDDKNIANLDDVKQSFANKMVLLPDGLKHDLVAWMVYLRRCQYAYDTQIAYQRALVVFADFLVEQHIYSWQDVVLSDVEQYFAGRLESGYQVLSARQNLSAISHFYQFLLKTQPNIKNPILAYRLSKAYSKLPQIADVDVMFRLLDQPTPDDPNQAQLWVRDRAIFELMYSSGLRVSELVKLNIDDVDLINGVVQVLGKGGKWRQIPIGKKARLAINQYLPYRDLWQKKANNALFVSKNLGTRLGVRAIQLRLKVCAKMANIPQNLYPHLLRHCFASHMLSACGDLRAVQEILGHANLSATQVYTHVDFGALASVYDKAHPRAIKK